MHRLWQWGAPQSSNTYERPWCAPYKESTSLQFKCIYPKRGRSLEDGFPQFFEELWLPSCLLRRISCVMSLHICGWNEYPNCWSTRTSSHERKPMWRNIIFPQIYQSAAAVPSINLFHDMLSTSLRTWRYFSPNHMAAKLKMYVHYHRSTWKQRWRPRKPVNTHRLCFLNQSKFTVPSDTANDQFLSEMASMTEAPDAAQKTKRITITISWRVLRILGVPMERKRLSNSVNIEIKWYPIA